MFNSAVIGTDFLSFTSFAVVIFLVDFLEELFGPLPLGILFSLTFNNNKNLFLLMSDKFSNKKLLDELKSHYKIELETQQNLDNKISILMATSGTVTGLLVGFGTFLVTKILLNYEFLYFSIASLIVAIIVYIYSFYLYNLR
jgi:hypothetical protein